MYSDAKYTATYCHSCPAEILKGKSSEGWITLDNSVIIFTDIHALLLELFEEIRAFELIELLLRVMQWKMRMFFG
jgi:hypothetical protein